MKTVIVFIFLALGGALAQSVDRIIDLPDGIQTKTLDLGPTGTVGIYPLGGGNYSVVEGRDLLDLPAAGAWEWEGHAMGTLQCQQKKKCQELHAGRYLAHFVANTVSVEYYRQDRQGAPRGKSHIASYSVTWEFSGPCGLTIYGVLPDGSWGKEPPGPQDCALKSKFLLGPPEKN